MWRRNEFPIPPPAKVFSASADPLVVSETSTAVATRPSIALFSIGELIQHKQFGYRGVIVGIDATFSLSDEWYEQMARSRPPKDEPWYQVLVHGGDHSTYVAQRNLMADPAGAPIDHPLIASLLGPYDDGAYQDPTQVH